MIVRDEAEVLARCLLSVRGLVDEIVVVDTGSTDGTRTIALEHGARVADFTWIDDFAAARNASLELATGEWALVLDADETLASEGHESVRASLGGDHGAYLLPLENLAPDGSRHAESRVTLLRLFRRDPRVRYEGRVHEQVTGSLEALGWSIGRCDALILHDGYTAERLAAKGKHARNLHLLEATLRDRPEDAYARYQLGKTLAAMGRLDEAREAFGRTLDVLDAELRPEAIAYYPRVFGLLAALEAERGSHEAALAIAERGLVRLTGSAELALVRGRSLLALGHLDEARESLAMARSQAIAAGVTGYDPSALASRAGVLEAQALQRLGRPAEALETLETLVGAVPHPGREPWLALATLALSTGRNALARDAYERVVGLTPDDFSAHLALATLYFEAGDRSRARAALDAVDRLKPGLPDVALLRRMCG